MAFTPNKRDQTIAADHFAAEVAREVASVGREEVCVLLGRARPERSRVLRAQLLNLGAILWRQRALAGK
jgi:hypothetical protein